MKSSRRTFVKQSLAGGTALLVSVPQLPPTPTGLPLVPATDSSSKVLDLAPARWIWLPAGRTLANSVILFRKTFTLTQTPTKATGWILGESRYKLYLNGERAQFGPAPADPRWAEADPVDWSGQVRAGLNVVGAEVLFYGNGDGTWPIGKPGFIFKLDLQYADGRSESIVSDGTWQTYIAASWRPGQFKRWYLRAFQEEFDARLYPYGWATIPAQSGNLGSLPSNWLPAQVINGAANKPAISTTARDYLYDAQGNAQTAELRRRSIPMLRENTVPAKQLSEQHWLRWKIRPESYFEFDLDESQCFEVLRQDCTSIEGQTYDIDFRDDKAAVLTFEFAEQHVGFPMFVITAPAGTIVELLVHEAHQIGGDALINSHFHSWTRFICREGLNSFETFDYESFRWLQLHIRNARGRVSVRQVGIRQRTYPFAQVPQVQCNDPRLQALLGASVNTMYNSCQEIVVDGMARERQQYSGDCGHQVPMLYAAFGDTALAARYLNTFSQGLTLEGYFLDCWPAYDRLARLMERQIGLTEWGPILDHGIGFNFDCYHYYLHTGNTSELAEVFPRLMTFWDYLQKIKTSDGLLPVENLGIPTVWMDHNAYKKQRHKQCAFNLYAAAMMQYALAPLCVAMQQNALAERVTQEGKALLAATVQKYWDTQRKIFVNNLPWVNQEGEIRTCDRSLATALLYGLCPQNQTQAAVRSLTQNPPEMGLSYPANTYWRYWALAKFGQVQSVLDEFRTRWWDGMASVRLNNTLAEDFNTKPDTGAQWSHCAVAPLVLFYDSVAGIKPTKPGYTAVEIRPQLGDLTSLQLEYHTVKGVIRLNLTQSAGSVLGTIDIPSGVTATLVGHQNTLLKTGQNTVNL